jgi:Tfp pilus assembly protein PilV
MNRGIVLVEVTIAYVLLTVGLIALLPVFIMAIKAGKSTEQLQTATYLSAELMEEIRLRKWDQNTPTSPVHISTPTASPLGPQAGETDKTKFNDIGDFNGWTESPPTDPLNNALSGFSAYSRSVTVNYVDSSMVVLSTPTTSDYKQVKVCTSTSRLSGICLATLFTNR